MMKTRCCHFLALLAAWGGAVCAAQEMSDRADNPLLKPPEPEVSREEVLEAYGYVVGRDVNDQLKLFPTFYSFGFSDEDFDLVMRGMAAAFKGAGAPVDLERVGPDLREFLDTRPEEVKQARLAASKAEEEEALKMLAERDDVQVTESGLHHDIKAPGSGDKPQLGDVVVAHYKGTFVNGSVFEDSRLIGRPARFSLGDVIPAWREGLQLIAPGGRIVLFATSDLAYGDTGFPPIPPGKMLVFDIELISVEPDAAQTDESAEESAAAPDAADLAPEPAAP